MENYKLKILQYMFDDKAVKCSAKCKHTPNSLVCKLKIFNATCPTKSLKDDHNTSCYKVIDKE